MRRTRGSDAIAIGGKGTEGISTGVGASRAAARPVTAAMGCIAVRIIRATCDAGVDRDDDAVGGGVGEHTTSDCLFRIR